MMEQWKSAVDMMQDGKEIFGYYNQNSFKCKCGKCKANQINQKIVDFCNYYFDKYKTILHITSGCRCVEHNIRVGGKDNSDHICIPNTKIAEAVDLAAITVEARSIIAKEAFSFGIDRVIVYPEKKFIHLSTNRKLTNPILLFNLRGMVY